MHDPHEVLGVAVDADPAEIRRRYLELVRQFPPDRDPERFTAIRAAFDEIGNPARRLERLILRPSSTDSIDAIAADVRARLSHSRMSLDDLLSLADLP